LIAAFTRHALRALTAVALASCAVPTVTTSGAQPSATPTRTDAPLPLIPMPVAVRRAPGAFTLTRETPLIVEADDGGALVAARVFAEWLERTTTIALKPRGATGGDDLPGTIRFVLRPARSDLADEAYTLDVAVDGVRVVARDTRGLLYGATTLWQLAGTRTARDRIEIPAVAIADAPRFHWRGLMLDSARHYLPPASIERILDQMAQLKLNTLHWHLTDDQGWRLEIKAHPRLVEIGAWRVPAGPAHAARRDANGEPVRIGGYYTHDDVRRIVHYAAERGIAVVPEIDMPGHAQAAIAAYPELGTGSTPGVSSSWGVHTQLFNVEESTFAFLEDVLDEVVALFPGPYVHVGGDEAAKDRWRASPRVQARMRELGIADEVALQAYFTRRIEALLAARGRRLIGWDEILDGPLPEAATVMSWRGPAGAVAAARRGHDVVMAPSPELYFDHYQSDRAEEPPGRPVVVTLADVYAYEPIPDGLDEAAAAHVLGAQAQLWSEHLRTAERVEYAAFPRVAALAERVWSPRATRDFASFAARIPAQLARYRAFGVGYAESAFAVAIDVSSTGNGRATVAFSQQAGLGEIRYTLDGAEPGVDSMRYDAPFDVAVPTVVRATAFVDGRATARPTRLDVDARTLATRTDATLKPCTEGLILRLEDDTPIEGERAVFRVDLFDPCWIYERARLDGVASIEIRYGELPYNFELWTDTSKIVRRTPATPLGELEIRRDRCDGAPWIAIPIAAPAPDGQLASLRIPIPPTSGAHDLCFVFTAPSHDPMRAIKSVTLE